MAGKSMLLGSKTRYNSGVVQVGAAPAKVTSASVRSIKDGVRINMVLPTDKSLSTIAIFAVDDPSTSQIPFPVGASPVQVGSGTKIDDDTAIQGVRRHFWVVTRDAHRFPLNPLEANAVYAGNIIPTGNSSVRVGVL